MKADVDKAIETVDADIWRYKTMARYEVAKEYKNILACLQELKGLRVEREQILKCEGCPHEPDSDCGNNCIAEKPNIKRGGGK